jgi:hypothetical protein
MSPYSKNYLVEKFGFRSYVASAVENGIEPTEAKELVERYLKRPMQYDPAHLLLNDNLIYVPHGWIGCSCFLVDRHTREVMLIGSFIVAFQAVWGYYRGISLAYERPERLQPLVIRAIHDAKGTMRALRYPLWIYPRLHPSLGDSAKSRAPSTTWIWCGRSRTS